MYDQLDSLWRRLGVDEEAMDAFVENHRGSTSEVVCQYEEELERMLELKRERTGTFIESARQEIVKLWDDLMVEEDERADFAPFVDGTVRSIPISSLSNSAVDEHTEELLIIHEDEIRRLKEERRLKAPLLASIRKYFDICDEEKELAMAAADQTRLLGRGPRDPGRLLREEKMRKRVSKEKPRVSIFDSTRCERKSDDSIQLERDLLSSIPVWEQETGRLFLVHGERILEMLLEAVAAADQENKRRPPRGGSVPPRATTPMNSNNGHAPGLRAVTPAVRPNSAASQSVPNKRQKLNDGHKNVRAPLSNHRGANFQTRPASPPRKTPGTVHKTNTLTKPRMQHRTGRTPSSIAYSGQRSVSASVKGSSIMTHGRSYNASKSLPGAGTSALQKASRTKRESFKPRPSQDHADLGGNGGIGIPRWGATLTCSVKEEEDEGA
jgi:protein regulator of cytokinesis 1